MYSSSWTALVLWFISFLVARVTSVTCDPGVGFTSDLLNVTITHPSWDEFVPNDIALRLDVDVHTTSFMQFSYLMNFTAYCDDVVVYRTRNRNDSVYIATTSATTCHYVYTVPQAVVESCKGQPLVAEVDVFAFVPINPSNTSHSNSSSPYGLLLSQQITNNSVPAPISRTRMRFVSCSRVLVHVVSNHLTIAYLISAGISALSSLVLIYYYARYPPLRRWPSNLVFWRTIADFLFSFQFVWLNAWELADSSHPRACNALIAFITQFAIFASLGWYFVLSLNVFFSISNPFQRAESKVKTYHFAVWSASILTGFMTVLDYAYRPDFQICWIRKTDGINLWNWVVAFAWFAFFSLAAVAVLVFQNFKLRGAAMQATLRTRQQSLRETRIYVIAFTLYWMSAAVIWFLVYPTTTNEIVQNRPLAYIFASVTGCMGTIDALVWLVIQWPVLREVRKNQQISALDLAAAAEAAEHQFGDISDALRYEFIATTSEGITKAGITEFQPEEEISDDSEDQGLGRHIQGGLGNQYSQLRMQLTGRNQPEEHFKEQSHFNSSSYEFVAYAPRVFASLRGIFGVTPKKYVESIEGDPNDMKQNFSEGRSGSFFYFTVDRKYIVKTITKAEYRVMLRILPKYYEFMHDNPLSLICRIYGLYSVSMYGHREFLCVMNNVLSVPSEAYTVDEIYDLKGSKIDRHGEPRPDGRVSVFKDLDLKKTVRVSKATADQIVTQICLDSEFLKSVGIMDYSLLLGVHNCEEPRTSQSHCKSHGAVGYAVVHEPVPVNQTAGHRDRAHTFPQLRRIGSSPGGVTPPTGTTNTTPDSASLPTSPASQILLDDRPASIRLTVLEERERLGVERAREAPARLGSTEAADHKNSDRSEIQASLPGTPESRRLIDPRQSVSSMTSASSIGSSHLLDLPVRRPFASTASNGSEHDPNPFSNGVAASVIVGPGIYHMGIIDILQEWTIAKRIEFWFKVIFRCHCMDWIDISAVEPGLFSERFLLMCTKLFTPDATRSSRYRLLSM